MSIKRPPSVFLAYIILIFFLVFTGVVQAQTIMLSPADSNIIQWKEKEFTAYDPNYKEELATRVARFRTLASQIITNEIAGKNMQLSHQIFSEMIWLISSSADFKRMDKRLDDLQVSFDHPELQDLAEEEDSTDGSWGKGNTEWFFKVTASYPHLKNARYELHFIDRINSPEKLTAYLTSISVSDIARKGIDHEREFNEAVSNLMRMIIRHRPKQYNYDPKLKETLMDLLLHRFRNPATGYWGESYVRDGQLEFVDDISMTFHIVSYLDGDVPGMDKVVATTLAAQDLEFPAGCLYKGQHYDHLNMDVAELFRLGWPYASDEQKTAISTELQKLLDWCLTESLQPDGSFKFWIGDNSKEESTYYGASFLARLGYFDKKRRFWTDKDFPDAEAVRQKIIAYIEKHIKSGATGGDYYGSALEELGYKKTD